MERDKISVMYIDLQSIHLCVLNPKYSNKKNNFGLMSVLWQMVHYIISYVPCANLFFSIERTLIHFIVILNGVYFAQISNINTNIVEDTTSHDSGGDSACFFLQWFIETPGPGLTEGPIEMQLPLS